MLHRWKRLIAPIGLLCALLLAAPALAQAGRPNHIAAELVVERPASPGDEVELAIHFTPRENWHGYWSNPGDAGQGMMLNWQLPAGWSAGEPRYPVPQVLVIQDLMNHVYEHDYAVLVPLTIPAGAAGEADYPIALDAQWLACSDTLCVPERGRLEAVVSLHTDGAEDERFDGWRAAIPPLLDSRAQFALTDKVLRLAIPIPATMDISAPHVFMATEDLVDYAAPQRFWRKGDWVIAEIPLKLRGDAPGEIGGILKLGDAGDGVRFVADPGEVPGGGDPIADPAGALAPLWVLLGGALLGGLLLNVMPCVFPILSLKALSLARAGESEREARREGLAYTGGVLVAVLALGALLLALRAAGNEIGWAFQLQEPGVVIALLVLAVLITANLAGLYELPGFSFAGSGGQGNAFLTGLLAAFVATPCTGPFMATAMGAALLLPTAQALLLFAVLGLGLALPFLALGWVPPLRKMLPRPGRWMDRFRKILAVPMGLTALALLWLSWRLGGPWFALAAVALAGLLTLGLTVLLRERAGGRRYRHFYAILAVVALASGWQVLPRLYVPPAAGAAGEVIAARPFSTAALAEARASGQPVFLWFTADWCVTCKVNEGVAIEREATRAAFEKAGVVAMKGDWTRRDAEITRFLTAQGAAGVPLYLWYEPGKEGVQLPQLLGPDSLVELASGDR